MKLPSMLIPMPAPSPASSTTLPLMPRPLAEALRTAEVLLAGRANLTKHLSEQTTMLPGLLRAKVESENALSRAQTAALLGEVGDVEVQVATDAVTSAERDYRSASGVRGSLRERPG